MNFTVRVYYEDTDVGGIVYYANYLKFAERARTELLRSQGIDQSQLLEDDQVAFVVRRVEVDYLKPAKLDDSLEIETTVAAIKAASLEMNQVIRRGDDVLIQLKVKVACIHLSGRAIKIPTAVRQKFLDMLGNTGNGK